LGGDGFPSGWQSAVYKATISSSGDIGTFSTTSQGQLPQTLSNLASNTVNIGGITYMYVLGGLNTGGGWGQSTVYKAQLDGSGNIGVFSTTGQGQLPTVNYTLSTVSVQIGINYYIYVIGGFDGSARQSAVYKATISSSGDIGTFSTTSQGQLPQGLSELASNTVNIGGITYMYVLGGYNDSSGYQSTVYKAQIDGSGNVGAFSTTSQGQLSQAMTDHTSVTATVGGTSYIYVLGGYNSGGVVQSTVYKATLSPNSVNPALTITNTGNVLALGYYGANPGSNLTLQASGATAGNGGNGSIYFNNSSGQTEGRLETIGTGNASNVGTFSTTSQAQLPQLLNKHTTVTATVGGTSYVYVLGGTNTGGDQSTVYRAQIDGSGNVIGTFSTTSQGQLPQLLEMHTTVTATVGGTSYIYVLGGTNGGSAKSTVYRAQINGSGNVGTFSTTGQGQLPQVLFAHTTVTATVGGTSYIYVLAGNSGGVVQSTVYRAQIDGSGNVGTFSTASQAQLPQALYTPNSLTAIVGGATYIYVLGGENSGGTRQSTVYRAQIDGSGNIIGTFSTASQAQLPQLLDQQTNVTTTVSGITYVYVLGGANNSGVNQSTVYRAQIDGSGNVGTFSTASQAQLPQAMNFHTTVTATVNGVTYVYVLGGYSGGSAQATVYKAQISLAYGTLFIGAVNTTSADVAENYPVSDPAIGPGDIVSLTSSDSAMLTKSAGPYDQHLFGVISTDPGIILGSNDSLSQNPNQRPVALKGRVPVNVSAENGPINIGDPLTSSNTPGVGMKATKPGQIIGTALEPFQCPASANQNLASGSASFGLVNPAVTSCQGTILVSINVGYYDPTPPILTAVENMKDFVINVATNSAAIVTDSTGNIVNRAEVLAGAVIGNLQVGMANIQQLTSDNIISPLASIDTLHTNFISPVDNSSNIALDLGNSQLTIRNGQTASSSAVAVIDNQGNATFSGTLAARGVQSSELNVYNDATISGTLHVGKVIADEIVGATSSATYVTNVTNIYNSTQSANSNFGLIPGTTSIGTSSETIGQQTAGGYIDISSYSGQLTYVDNLAVATASFSQGLMVFGPTSLSDTSIVGQLSIDGNLILANDSVNVLGADLNLQPLRQGGLSIMGGLVYIDTNGNLKIGGNADFAKNVTVNGTLATNIISPLPGNDLSLDTGNSNLNVNNASNSSVLSVNSLGDLVASGAATIAKLNLSLIQPAFAISPTEIVATGSAGTASITPYNTQVTIDNPSVTGKSLIYITPTSNTNNQVLYLLRQAPGQSFTVGLQNPSVAPIPFNWIIVN
jgi:hypothetical protein